MTDEAMELLIAALEIDRDVIDRMRIAAEARAGKAEDALRHILWVKDCGIDATDEHGVFRNHPDAERDAMYRIAKDALKAASLASPAGRKREHIAP